MTGADSGECGAASGADAAAPVSPPASGAAVSGARAGTRSAAGPLEAALASGTRGDRMNYDIEIPVRMVWNGVPVINEPVGVRYLTEEEGGISSYQTLRDTARISATHCRLVFEGLWRFLRAPRAAVRWRLARKQHG